MKILILASLFSMTILSAFGQEQEYYSNKGETLQEKFNKHFFIPAGESMKGEAWFFFCEVSVHNKRIDFIITGLDNEVLKGSILSFFKNSMPGWNLRNLKKKKVLIPILVSSDKLGVIAKYADKENSFFPSGSYFVFSPLEKHEEIISIDEDPPGMQKN